jgi:hypothetical protein
MAEVSALARVARAVFALTLMDIANGSRKRGRKTTHSVQGREAVFWLFHDGDPDLADWRQILADLGDVSIEGIRKVALSAPPEQLRRVARAMGVQNEP